MPKTDPRVDAYIAQAAPFARPILAHLRALVHRAEPAIEETMKWGMPFFEREGIVCHLAAFKAHCAFGIWRGGQLEKTGKEGEAMGQFGRIATLGDLPPDATIVALAKKAVARNLAGEKAARPVKRAKQPIPMPAELAGALAKNRAARTTFDAFPPGQQREYLEWITEAKTAATRDKRIATAVEWLALGKTRNWKYRK